MSEQRQRAEAAFFDLYSDGKVSGEAIDDFIDVWHREMVGRPQTSLVELHDYLGMSRDEFEVWVQKPDALPNLRNARLDGKTIKRSV